MSTKSLFYATEGNNGAWGALNFTTFEKQYLYFWDAGLQFFFSSWVKARVASGQPNRFIVNTEVSWEYKTFRLETSQQRGVEDVRSHSAQQWYWGSSSMFTTWLHASSHDHTVTTSSTPHNTSNVQAKNQNGHKKSKPRKDRKKAHVLYSTEKKIKSPYAR